MAKTKTTTQTREGWLLAGTALLAPEFERLGAPLPSNVRMAVGFPSTGKRGKRIGECWSSQSSADKHFEIFIHPRLANPEYVLAVLAHELTHAAVGLEAKHGPKFGRVARGLGLVGKLTATEAGEAFKAMAKPMLAKLGALPHASLVGAVTADKKHGTRMIKCVCEECGYTVRTTQKWLDVGLPQCPDHGDLNPV